MSLSIDTALTDGLERLGDRRLVGPYLAIYAVHVAIMVATHSQLEAQRDEFGEMELLDEPMIPEELPLAVDVPVGVASLLSLVSMLLLVTVSIVAFRSLVNGEAIGDGSETAVDGGVTGDVSGTKTTTDGLLWATVHGVAAAIVGVIAVVTGLFFLVVPGLVVATVFAFTHPYIAIERASVVEAMKRSLELTGGNRLSVFGVLIVVVLSFYAVSFVGVLVTIPLGGQLVVAELVNVAFGALAWLVVLAILASAFEQLETARTEYEDKWEGIDDELLP